MTAGKARIVRKPPDQEGARSHPRREELRNRPRHERRTRRSVRGMNLDESTEAGAMRSRLRNVHTSMKENAHQSKE